MSHPINRRNVLRGAGGVAISLPILSSLQSGSARADAVESPRRLIFAEFANLGVSPPQWNPKGSGPDLQLNTSMAPLEGLKSKVSMFSGVNMLSAHAQYNGRGAHLVGENHALTANDQRVTKIHCGSNEINNPTPDQIQSYVADTKICNDPISVDIFGTRGSVEIPEAIGSFMPTPLGVIDMRDDATTIWDRVFAPYAGDAKARLRRLATRSSVLDSVKVQLDQLNKKLSVEDQKKLDAHATALRDTERLLKSAKACTPPGRETPAPNDRASYHRIKMELLNAAFACDLARVARIPYYEWLLFKPERLSGRAGYDEFAGLRDEEKDEHGWHSHSRPSDCSSGNWSLNRRGLQCGGLIRASITEVAEICKSLKGKPDGGGTLFDSTAVFGWSSMNVGLHTYRAEYGPWSKGASQGDASLPDDWCSWGVPYFAVGDMGGKLRTGKHFDFRGRNSYPGAGPGKYSHGELFLTLARAMGVGSDRMPTFGKPEFCRSVISEWLV